MILDYSYSKNKHLFSISYIKENGAKDIVRLNTERFVSFYKDPEGKFTNWDGDKCSIKYLDKPDWAAEKFFIRQLESSTKISPEAKKYIFEGKTIPKLYTFDIETYIPDDNEFPEPSEAKFPITTISIASPDCNVLVLGTRDITSQELLSQRFNEYVEKTEFFKTLGIKIPYIRYVKFNSERDMLKYFLENIVAKVPVLAGWNSLLFDWQYIQNRVRGYYSDLFFNCCSPTMTLHNKRMTDKRDNDVTISVPDHTLVIDMMDVIGTFDLAVMPIKESLALDYIAHESIGVNKIEYDGTLGDLYKTDYDKYVFYNAIDSFLVQLIDKKFKTMDVIYMQARYCKDKVSNCFSKIAISEALTFDYFYKQGIQVVTDGWSTQERGNLQGAYVKVPIPGKHRFVTCNDFASLYPSTIITCNLSFENYMGGTLDGTFREEELDKYRNDPNYFVSVNGNVYKNDKDYAFRIIQQTLKSNRGISKYLSKDLDAKVMLDIEHVLNGRLKKSTTYSDSIQKALTEIGYDIKSADDFKDWDKTSIYELRRKLRDEITYHICNEQAMKLLGNSMYGGSSHVKFFWFNIHLAGDITGEARNIIHRMEHHLPEYFLGWPQMTDIHTDLGIELIENPEKLLENVKVQEDDPDASHIKSYVTIVYGDTDSLYTSYSTLLNTIKGIDQMTLEQKTKILIDLNTKYIDQHNEDYIREYYKTRFAKSVHKFELETLNLSGCWLDVKKRYAQILLWKDGKYYDTDNLPLKIKGLEMIKTSVPKAARESLKKLVRYLLEDNDDDYLIQRLNIRMQEEKTNFYNASIEDQCANVKVNGYTKYIVDDSGNGPLQFKPGTPFNVKALGTYNYLRNKYKLPGEPIYGGKLKLYQYYPILGNKKDIGYFAFTSMAYPKWAPQYAPIAKNLMFNQYIIDPFNRILTAIGLPELNPDGSIQISLFDSLF